MCYDTGRESRRPMPVQSLVIVVYPLFNSMHSLHRINTSSIKTLGGGLSGPWLGR